MNSELFDYKNTTLHELAGLVSQAFTKNGLNAVLVGGGCVSIYTHNKYQSYDLDFITYDMTSKVKNTLKEIGFVYDSKKYYAHPDCPFYVEFLTPPISVGYELVTNTHSLESKTGVIKLLTPTDCVKDRLSAFFHWDDRQSLEQALMVTQSQDVDLENIKTWAKKEGHEKKYMIFLNTLSKESA